MCDCHLCIGSVLSRSAINDMHNSRDGDDIPGALVGQVALGFYVRLGLCLPLGHARQDRGVLLNQVLETRHRAAAMRLCPS